MTTARDMTPTERAEMERQTRALDREIAASMANRPYPEPLTPLERRRRSEALDALVRETQEMGLYD